MSIIIKGLHVQLEPIHEIHRQPLSILAHEEKVSTFSPTLRLNFNTWFDKALKTTNQFAFIVRTLEDDQIVGSTRFYDIEENHKRLAIGYTWYTSRVWGSKVNPECKLLLLRHAFEVMQMNRVEFHIDSRNVRSIAAVKKLGAKYEGVLRKHIVLDDGYVRDTVILSIIKEEWSETENLLKNRLNT